MLLTPDRSFVFRYLLYMYRILGTDDYVCTKSPSSPNSSTTYAIHDSTLRSRIKEACRGHLRWCFHRDVFLAKTSWPLGENIKNDLDTFEDDPGLESFTGSLHILKLFEFSQTFNEDEVLVEECLQACANRWLDALVKGRDTKSGLWYRTRQTYVPWEHYDYEESERLSLPEYRLGDLIYIWKALKSVERLTTRLSAEKGLLPSISKRLNDLGLHHDVIRKIILQRFC